MNNKKSKNEAQPTIQVQQIVSGRLYLNQQIAIKNEPQNITRADHDVKNGYSKFYTEKYIITQLHNNIIMGIEAR